MTNEITLGGDLRIRRMGYGAMRLPARGLQGPPGDRDTALAVLRRAVGLGVNHIDTASFYAFGDLAANEFIHAALHPYPEGLVIATKVGPRRGPDRQWLAEAGPGDLRDLVEQNLRELGLDRLDLVYLRIGGIDGPPNESLAERFAVLAGLREEGLIRHLGVSNVNAAHLVEAQTIAPVAAVQNRYSVIAPEDDAVLDACARQGIAYVPYFPLGGFGVPDDARLTKVAARHDATAAQIMLAWLLARSPAVLAIPGTSSLAHLEENMAASAITLTQEDLADLDRLWAEQGNGSRRAGGSG
ncbi:oxidoreductase [Thermomonospora umbrina]|uniref:Aryl-alcohol dehydrogenase-like predicted oxidoreductase n=1 Tax=Thermomonospora umbrina TaxID=111806 RepID=A0A3D9SFT2_9ACTN|nr:oxidoreductase [Thermomonospora umbrina]REE94749.1 aryl-alcohol dehydrogenase-like predicted oxidoreductase [Thermomonospora umbrina]